MPTAPHARPGRFNPARQVQVASPTGQRRDKISGNWLTAFWFARAGRPLGPPGEKCPGQVPGSLRGAQVREMP
eukprot:645340-Pyramimonas_sp.AAC.1